MFCEQVLLRVLAPQPVRVSPYHNLPPRHARHEDGKGGRWGVIDDIYNMWESRIWGGGKAIRSHIKNQFAMRVRMCITDDLMRFA